MFWNGNGISYTTSKEPYKIDRLKNKELRENNLIGKFEEKEIKGSEFSSLPYIEHAHKKARVYESLHIDGDLDLNQLYKEEIYTVIVKNHLTVSGNIINSNANFGSSLFVLGETLATNLIAGGSIIALNRAKIKDFTIGFYNDGYLSIELLYTDILLNFGHDTALKDKSNINVHLNSFYYELDKEDSLNDITMLAKYLYEHKEYSKMVDREEDDDEVFYCKRLYMSLIKMYKDKYNFKTIRK